MSDDFKNGNREAKRKQEGSLKVFGLETPTSFGDDFERDLKSEECVNFSYSVMRNLEKEEKEIQRLDPWMSYRTNGR